MTYTLPKKHNRKEAKFDSLVAEKVHKLWAGSFALEVKVDKGKVKDHQEKALQQVVDDKFLYKIPDQGRRNPFDYVGFKGADAIVCTVDSSTRNTTCVVYNTGYEFSFKV